MLNEALYSVTAILSLSFALGIILTVVARKILIRRKLFDLPNKRSAHKEPVPRGGGWAILGVLILGMAAMITAQGSLPVYAGLMAGVFVLAFISWRDDSNTRKGGTGVIMRLSLHLLAACLGSLVFAPGDMIFGGALPFWADRALMIVGWAWFMNLYNFMDGIDGMTGAETICLATGACFLMAATGMHDDFLSALTLLLTGACLGFLALNWYPAKIFMGDIGSVPLGFLTGYLMLALAVKGHFIPALILPLYYLADSGITLGKRTWRGEKIWQAHRQHFYQRAAQALKRHDTVVYAVIIANIALIIASVISVAAPLYGLALAILIVAVLLGWMSKNRA